jgi:hypothetical protein
MDAPVPLASWVLPVLIGGGLGIVFVVAFFWDNRENWSPQLRRALGMDQSASEDSAMPSSEVSRTRVATDPHGGRTRSVFLGFAIATGGLALGILIGIAFGSVWAGALISWLAVFAVVIWLQRTQRASR